MTKKYIGRRTWKSSRPSTRGRRNLTRTRTQFLGWLPVPRAYRGGENGFFQFPEPRRELGLGSFPNPSAYIEGKGSETNMKKYHVGHKRIWKKYEEIRWFAKGELIFIARLNHRVKICGKYEEILCGKCDRICGGMKKHKENIWKYVENTKYVGSMKRYRMARAFLSI